MGLIMNGILKVPMQFFILLTGVLVFVFFQFNDAPLHFNPTNVAKVKASEQKVAYENLEQKLVQLNTDKIYLINKNNHSGCEKLLNSNTPSYAWNINIRKYVKPVLKANVDIPQNVINKLNFIILTETPDNKNISAETFIKQQISNNAPYCEALNFSFI